MRRIIICSIWIILLCLCSCQQQPAEVSTAPTTSAAADPSESTDPTVYSGFPMGVLPEHYPPAVEKPYEPEAPDPVEALLQTMTVEEKVGQLFLARCPDINAIQDIKTYRLGGYILFGRDFSQQTPESIASTLAAYQQAAKIPMLIAVDEEGGTVTRVSSYKAFRSNRFPSPRNLYSQGGLSLLLDTEEEKCRLLASLGIQVNMAPVCDITTNARSFMYSRSLGLSAQKTSEAISAMVQVAKENGVGAVLKHFPGYGNNTDTHSGIAVDNRTLAELESNDLVPFAAGIQAGCDAILVSHTFVNAMDTKFPASLSLPVHRYLRNRMGFDGVIVTDDLAMGAITDLYGAEEAAVLAVLSGNDLLCCSEYAIQYQAVLEAVQDGRIPQNILDQAVRRVLSWKQSLGLLES